MKTEAPTSLKGWHFLRADKRLNYEDERIVRVGKRREMSVRTSSGKIVRDRGRPDLCVKGMHACQSLKDVLAYAAGPVLCRVTVDTDLDIGQDKFCGRFRTVHAMVDLTDSLNALAIDWFKYTAKSKNQKIIAAAFETALLTETPFKAPAKIQTGYRGIAEQALERSPITVIKGLKNNSNPKQLAWLYRRFAHYVKKAGLV